MTLLNTSQTNNSTRTKYEEMTYQTAALEFKELDLEEIEYVIINLKNNKTLGENNINSELFKITGKDIIKEIQSLIREIWHNEQISND